MELIQTPLEGLLVIKPKVFEDKRGFFFESYNKEKFAGLGITNNFVQDNHSFSVQNTIRGLHYQSVPGQEKLLRVVRGKVWDVAVDIRKESPTFGQWFAQELSEENKLMFYIPIGFAHGFCILSKEAEVLYKVSNLFNPETEKGIAWNDKELNVKWPIKNPIVSERDNNNPSFSDY